MLEQRIQQQFFESADLLYQAAEPLSRPIATAAQMLLEGITGGGRLLCCGQGLAELDARYMTALLIGRFEQDRPGLAALCLDAQTPGTASAEAALARQVQALGHPGDLLLLIDGPANDGPTTAWAAVIAAAQAQDMSVIALTGGIGLIGSITDPLRGLLRDTDVQIHVQHSRAARIKESQRLLAHCLCDAVDMQLLGATE